jgi:hypothetical protein
MNSAYFEYVGPILTSGNVADAVIAAIEALNERVVVIDRGAYRRVLAPSPCRVTAQAVETYLGREFQLPQDLEMVMNSFKGRLEINEQEAVWKFAKH